MSQVVTDLGEIGLADAAMVTPLDLTLLRNGAAWNLTGYTSPVFNVWKLFDRQTVTPSGTISIEDAANGIVRYLTTGAADTLIAEPGTYEAVVVVNNGGGIPEPSGLFRFTVGSGPNP